MERELAKEVSTKASIREVIKTLQNAESKTVDWAVRSEVNRGCTKGTAFNLFVRALIEMGKNNLVPSGIKFIDYKYGDRDWQIDALINNIIWEFGEFYPNVVELTRKWQITGMSHQDPIEVDWSELTEEEPETQRIK